MTKTQMTATRIAIVFEGTRGDCQPYCIGGRALAEAAAVWLAPGGGVSWRRDRCGGGVGRKAARTAERHKKG